MAPLLLHLLIILGSLYILIKSSDLAVYGITRYARKLGLSDYLIGLIVVSLAASLPELVASLNGSILGDSGIILGAILGSNIAGIGLVMGVLAVIGKEVKLTCKILDKTKVDIFLLVLLPFVLMLDSVLDRIDGVILILAYAIWLGILWRREGDLGKIKKSVKFRHIYRDALIFIGCLVAILLSARWLVFSSITIANLLGISSFIISLIVIGIGSSVPDLTVGIRSVFRHHQDVGVGDALGSLIMKSLLFLGILALLSPIYIEWSMIWVSVVFLLLMTALVLIFSMHKTMHWKKGAVLLGLYLLFIALQFI